MSDFKELPDFYKSKRNLRSLFEFWSQIHDALVLNFSALAFLISVFIIGFVPVCFKNQQRRILSFSLVTGHTNLMHRCMKINDFCGICLYSRKRFARVPLCIFLDFLATPFGGQVSFRNLQRHFCASRTQRPHPVWPPGCTQKPCRSWPIRGGHSSSVGYDFVVGLFSVFLIRGGRKRETAQNERKSAERMYVWLYEIHIARTKTFRGMRKDGSVGVMERAAQEQTCWNHGSHRRQRKKKVGRETRCKLIHNTAPKGDPKGKRNQKSAHPTS